MNFFEQQEAARRSTRRLVVLFLLAVAAIVVAVNIVSALAFIGLSANPASAGLRLAAPASFYTVVTLATLALIAGGSMVQSMRLAGGGAALARMMGARPVSRASTELAERRLLNVVEEMAIASGIAVPQVFVMEEQQAINAFAAGYSPSQAAVVVTRGTLDARSALPDLREGAADAVRVARELHRRGVGEEFALARHARLDQAAKEHADVADRDQGDADHNEG